MGASLQEAQESLTARERDVVQWVLQGMTNKEIAVQLGIADKTVKTHLSNIFNKLKISRRLQLVLNRVVE
ncbi:MAG: helix-turn-helix transcriptional regulator [Candidatus Methylomirabilis sp.]|nr:helix-turn-helix transcriptional regulator [Candidatus Methylomirabilis sp.]